MSLISTFCYKSYWYFIIYLVFYIVISQIRQIFLSEISKNYSSHYIEYEYLFLLYFCISDLLAGVLVLITKILTKSEKKAGNKINT